jgi:hypothetical protein
MGADSPVLFVRLATLPDPAAADLCAALLRSAGIPSRLRGESLGPYRLTIGDMAATEVWVPAAQVEDARAVLEETTLPGGVEFAPDRAEDEGPAAGWQRWWPVVALALLALAAWGLLQRFF